MTGEQKIDAIAGAGTHSDRVWPVRTDFLGIRREACFPQALDQIFGHCAFASRGARDVDHIQQCVSDSFGGDMLRRTRVIRMGHRLYSPY